jgi:predicted nucleotide-binding protein (sugar kinase/HSP70/actin superfamily)
LAETRVFSFPHIGNYCVVIENMLRHIFKNHKVLVPPAITKRTLELGSKYSPDFVCVPFKYNLGNFIEALEAGANVLIQSGGGCRYGYYAEIQEQILRDLGYKFDFIRLFAKDMNARTLYRTARRFGTRLGIFGVTYYVLLATEMVRKMDLIEAYIRENVGFEVVPGSFERLHKSFLKSLGGVDNFRQLNAVFRDYRRKFKSLKVDKPQNCLKVGLVGELYTLMEPFSNYYIEKELAKNKIQISRFITVTFLLFQKPKLRPKILLAAGRYLKYDLGADGTDSVERSRALAERGYDGIIHIKPFGCIPEINAMPVLQKISRDFRIPILYFSFDSQTSEVGVKTRLEAFCDMLLMRKEVRT